MIHFFFGVGLIRQFFASTEQHMGHGLMTSMPQGPKQNLVRMSSTDFFDGTAGTFVLCLCCVRFYQFLSLLLSPSMLKLSTVI